MFRERTEGKYHGGGVPLLANFCLLHISMSGLSVLLLHGFGSGCSCYARCQPCSLPDFSCERACMPNTVQVGPTVQIPVLVKGNVNTDDDRRLFNFRLYSCITTIRACMLVVARTFSLPSQALHYGSPPLHHHFSTFHGVAFFWEPCCLPAMCLGEWQQMVAEAMVVAPRGYTRPATRHFHRCIGCTLLPGVHCLLPPPLDVWSWDRCLGRFP